MRQRTAFPCLVLRSLLALALAALLGAGCAARAPSQSALPPDSTTSTMVTEVNSALTAAALRTPASTADYRLGAEDVIEIVLFNIKTDRELLPRTAQVQVSQDGMITLPLLGDIPVAGLTPSALEQTLRERYGEYLHHPQVGVRVVEYKSQRISVVGAVRQPGVFPLTSPKTLVDLLSMAGGINERAGSQVHIYRQENEGRHRYVVDLLALANSPGLMNMPIQAGDVIEVPQAGTFFVDGAVARPGSYPFIRPYTLTQALVLAGGVDTDLSDNSNVAIFRRRGSANAERIAVDLKEIEAGKAADPQIEPDDVIVVPIHSAKWFLERFIGRIGMPGIPSPRTF